MVGIERFSASHHRPQDPGILVSQGDNGLLPARALTKSHCPLRDLVVSAVRRQHRRFGALDQQRAQVGVASFGDATQIALAAAGVLTRRQADPGTELGAVLELGGFSEQVQHLQGKGGELADLLFSLPARRVLQHGVLPNHRG